LTAGKNSLTRREFIKENRRVNESSERGIDADKLPAQTPRMAKKSAATVGQASRLSPKLEKKETGATPVLRSSSLLDTRVIYCGDNLEQLAKLPDACVDLICIDPPFNSNRSYGQRTGWHSIWGESKQKRAFENHHENTKIYGRFC
jgi:hypothetical protein